MTNAPTANPALAEALVGMRVGRGVRIGCTGCTGSLLLELAAQRPGASF
jgi:hypothetical protein